MNDVAEGCDALVIATDWPIFKKLDLERVRKAMTHPILFDGRNLFDVKEMESLGFILQKSHRGVEAHDWRQRDSRSSPKAIDVSAGLVFAMACSLSLQRRLEDHLGGLWEFPGGKRHADETDEACLQRELMEELGIEVEVGDLIETIDHDYPEKTVRLKFFRCRWLRHEPRTLGCQNFCVDCLRPGTNSASLPVPRSRCATVAAACRHIRTVGCALIWGWAASGIFYGLRRPGESETVGLGKR